MNGCFCQSGVFIVNFERILHTDLVFPLFTLSKYMPTEFLLEISAILLAVNVTKIQNVFINLRQRSSHTPKIFASSYENLVCSFILFLTKICTSNMYLRGYELHSYALTKNCSPKKICSQGIFFYLGFLSQPFTNHWTRLDKQGIVCKTRMKKIYWVYNSDQVLKQLSWMKKTWQ